MIDYNEQNIVQLKGIRRIGEVEIFSYYATYDFISDQGQFLRIERTRDASDKHPDYDNGEAIPTRKRCRKLSFEILNHSRYPSFIY